MHETSESSAPPIEPNGLRVEVRKPTDCDVELTWKSEQGEKQFGHCRATDITEGGVAVECPEALPLMASVIVTVPRFHVAALAQVRHCTWQRSIYVLGLRFLARTTTVQSDPYAADHYELLRLSPGVDAETIERVYRKLAKRFHPDNPETGDAETFLRIAEAHRVLSDPQKRLKYDAERIAVRASPRFQFRSAEFFSGVLGEQNRRMLVNEDQSLTERGKLIVQNTPFGRFGEAAELHGAVHYLLADASRFVTGTVLAVDGGFSAFSGV